MVPAPEAAVSVEDGGLHVADETKFKQPKSVPAPNIAGYPQTDVKTSGIKVRGTGAAKKGTKARGPMG